MFIFFFVKLKKTFETKATGTLWNKQLSLNANGGF